MPRKHLNEEKLADIHVRRIGEEGILRSVMAVLFLTLFAAVVIIPFVYMFLTSLKGAAEIGNGRIMPDVFSDFTRLGNRQIAWVRVQLTDEQMATLNGISEAPKAPIVAAPAENFVHMLLPALPADTVWARRLSLEKPGPGSPVVIGLFEVPDPYQRIQQGKGATLLCPDPSGNAWAGVQAMNVPRTLPNLLGRLFVNYKVLADWETLKHGRILSWISNGYPRWYVNSLFVAFATVVIGLFFDSLAGFAFAKFNFPFRRALFALLIATIMIPYPVTLVPTFFLFAKMGFYNTYAALIVPGMVSAFGIFLVRQYVQTIPNDMLDAARVDGASDFSVYRHVILPTARPVLAALAVFRFIWQWNTYLYPLVLTNRDQMKTVQLGLATMQESFGFVDYGIQMAGATLAIVPILVFYVFMQKHFIAGITLGSVKD